MAIANPKRKLAALCLCTVLVTGCTSVKVVRNPDEGDTGIRFFRPKPYLLVTPADPTGRLVNLKLEYLPDFNEEYSAHVKGKASVALKDGWNLVGVNTKEAPKEKEEPPAKIEDIKLPPAVVAATNVPIGYYESVYGYNGPKKFLQGWRYIGMTTLGGGTPNVCRVPGHSPNCPAGGGNAGNGCINGPLYGLVFFNGAMTFRQVDEIANNQLCPMYVNPAPADAPAAPAATAPPEVRPETKDQRPSVAPDTTAPPSPPTPAVNPTAGGPPPSRRPAATPAVAVAPAAKASSGTAASKKVAAPAPVASTVPARKPAAGQVATTTLPPLPPLPAPGLDPATRTPPSLDSDLFRTGTSPRP